MQTGNTPVYTDFQGIANLRQEAQVRPGQALDEVASQFESLFVQMMLKSMRDATVDGGLFNSDQLDSYQQMFDQQLALDLSAKGGVGLADMLVQQMGDYLLNGDEKKPRSDASAAQADAPEQNFDHVRRQVMDSVAAAPVGAPLADTNATNSATDASLIDAALAGDTPASQPRDWLPESPVQYIKDVWDHATSAARELGVDPAVLVAQSALETGWGKKVTADERGQSSFNLFNIKANQSWAGAVAKVSTLEFRDGVAAMEKAAFRVYDSVADSFADYVDLVKGSPRYQKALEVASDSQQYLQELQQAGYATDPAYADKIMGILGQENYQSLMAKLKNF
jgi:flagellar protein FlgJ